MTCTRKPGNATSVSQNREQPDFIAGNAPFDVTFQENETTACECVDVGREGRREGGREGASEQASMCLS